MAITYPLALPSNGGIKTVRMIARSVVGESRSPFSGVQKIYEYPGQWFEAIVNLPPMKRADAEAWNVFRLKLNGKKGTFLMGDPAAATARGSAATTPGTPLVKGAGQSGNTLIIDGLPTSVTGYFKEGDQIQLGTGSTSRLYKNLTDVNTNGSGEATLTLWPNLRVSPNDNEAVVVANCVGLFRLMDNEMGWDIDEASMYGINFTACEAL
jgi:hypothetical protein